MAPRRAAEIFFKKNPSEAHYRVTLFASLAATGKGHLTDKAIEEVFSDCSLEIFWHKQQELPLHPNGMLFEALNSERDVMDSWEVYSIGGGSLVEPGQTIISEPLYTLSRMGDIVDYCLSKKKAFWEYVLECEGDEIWDYLDTVWKTMKDSLERGLVMEGVLPGSLGIFRKASSLLLKTKTQAPDLKRDGFLAAYAYAVAEENANRGTIVTAPTCGACGILPSVLSYLIQTIHPTHQAILQALATAGLIGNIVKENASISGAEVGCQGEVGTACSMAAGAAVHLLGGSISQIEYAAEMGLEHHLGLTCDPVGGFVQIPCIERNAHAATRALSCCHFALLSDGVHKISFDDVVAVMKETGHALSPLYRETSTGGLANIDVNREHSNQKTDKGKINGKNRR